MVEDLGFLDLKTERMSLATARYSSEVPESDCSLTCVKGRRFNPTVLTTVLNAVHRISYWFMGLKSYWRWKCS